MSAKAPGRPVFNEMMQRLYRGEAAGIICWKLDRLARNSVDGGAIIWAIKQHGIKVMTPAQKQNRAFEIARKRLYNQGGVSGWKVFP